MRPFDEVSHVVAFQRVPYLEILTCLPSALKKSPDFGCHRLQVRLNQAALTAVRNSHRSAPCCVDMTTDDTDQSIAVGRPFLFKRAQRIPWRALTRHRHDSRNAVVGSVQSTPRQTIIIIIPAWRRLSCCFLGNVLFYTEDMRLFAHGAGWRGP